MLVERHQAAQRSGGQLVEEHGSGRAVALEGLVRHQPVLHAFGFQLLHRLAESEGLGLGEHVGHQQVVVAAQLVPRLRESDEVAGDELGALVYQLVEGVLAVGAGLPPVDLAGLVIHRAAVEGDALAVALHGQLLQVGREALEVLLVGQHRYASRAEEIVVPDAEQAHQRRDVLLEGGGAVMLVHLAGPGEHLAEMIRADG